MNLRSQQGFTLIEALIAITLLAVGILAAASMQISAVGGNMAANRVTTASTWAADHAEYLAGLPYTHADLADTDGDGLAGLSDRTVATADGNVVRDLYTVYWNVVDGVPQTNSKTIRIVVVRNEKGIERALTFDVIKANEG